MEVLERARKNVKATWRNTCGQGISLCPKLSGPDTWPLTGSGPNQGWALIPIGLGAPLPTG